MKFIIRATIGGDNVWFMGLILRDEGVSDVAWTTGKSEATTFAVRKAAEDTATVVGMGDVEPEYSATEDAAMLQDAQQRLRASREILGLDPDTGKRAPRAGRGLECVAAFAQTMPLDPGRPPSEEP
jgi:hypothetical protein